MALPVPPLLPAPPLQPVVHRLGRIASPAAAQGMLVLLECRDHLGVLNAGTPRAVDLVQVTVVLCSPIYIHHQRDVQFVNER